VLPLGDPRLVEEQQQGQGQEERRVGTVQGRGSERARRGGVSGAAGGGDCIPAPGRLRDTVTALAGKADGEESTSCGKSDQLAAVETASTVDSQVTEG
jgi:hypothetical protein